MLEPTKKQYIVVNALDTLGLLLENRYDEDIRLFLSCFEAEWRNNQH